MEGMYITHLNKHPEFNLTLTVFDMCRSHLSICNRMDEYALMIGTSSSESTSKSISLDGARRMALKHIEAFVITFMDPQIFVAAAVSSTPTMLAQVTESARIQEAGHLRCRLISVPCV